MWANFHTHSTFCDGKGTLLENVAAAREQGLVSLGFSSHAPLPFACAWCMKPAEFGKYLSEITAAQMAFPELTIYKGLEVDFIPGVIHPAQFEDQLDYTIGSIHFVEAFPDGRRWEIDGAHTGFLEGLQAIFQGNIQAAVTRYFELTREMIHTACPTIIGHLDKIKIQNTGHPLFHESETWYQQEMKKTVHLIREAGCLVEVNTRGLYQQKSDTTYPGPAVLKLLLENDIPITLSSDAHHPRDLINHFPESAGHLNDLGFKRISILKEGNWTPVRLTPNGISFENA